LETDSVGDEVTCDSIGKLHLLDVHSVKRPLVAFRLLHLVSSFS